MRILYFSSFFVSQGGASLSFLKLIENFNDRGFSAYVMLPQEAQPQVARLDLPAELVSHFEYLAIDRISRQLLNPVRLLRFIARAITGILLIRRYLRRMQIDVVHSNDLRDFHAPVAAWSCSIPVVWHLRASRPNPLTRIPVMTMIHAFADKIVAVSHFTARQMALTRSFKQNKVAVIYDSGPYREQFHPCVDGTTVRREFGIAPHAPLITLVAKFSRRKGHLLFIKAIPMILENFPQARFMIVGGGLEGHESYAREVREAGARFVLAQRLFFTGERGDVPEIMAASDVIVQCSVYDDPFPGVVLEAMALGKVVVATASGGIPEQITDGEDGLLFKMGDAQDLAQKVTEILANPKRGRALAQAAAEKLEHKFSFGKFVRELEELYRGLGAVRHAQAKIELQAEASHLPEQQHDAARLESTLPRSMQQAVQE